MAKPSRPLRFVGLSYAKGRAILHLIDDDTHDLFRVELSEAQAIRWGSRLSGAGDTLAPRSEESAA